MEEQPSRLPMILGFILVAAGWAVIFLGWYQAGRQDLETGQLPYIISGGFGGFGLVVLGAIAILIDVVRQAEVKLRRSASELHERMQELAETFVQNQRPVRRESADDGAREPVAPRRRRRRKPTSRAQ